MWCTCSGHLKVVSVFVVVAGCAAALVAAMPRVSSDRLTGLVAGIEFVFLCNKTCESVCRIFSLAFMEFTGEGKLRSGGP